MCEHFTCGAWYLAVQTFTFNPSTPSPKTVNKIARLRQWEYLLPIAKCPSSTFWHRKWCWCVTIPIVRREGNVLSLSVHQGRGYPGLRSQVPSQPLVPGHVRGVGWGAPQSGPGWGGGDTLVRSWLCGGGVSEGYTSLFSQVPSQPLDPGPFWLGWGHPSQVLARGQGIPQSGPGQGKGWGYPSQVVDQGGGGMPVGS